MYIMHHFLQYRVLSLAVLNVLYLESIYLLFPLFLFSCAAPPHMIEKPQDMQKAIDDSLVWECMAIGKPKPSYRWMKNGENLEPAEVCYMFEHFLINNLIKAYQSIHLLHLNFIVHSKDKSQNTKANNSGLCQGFCVTPGYHLVHMHPEILQQGHIVPYDPVFAIHQ